MLCGLFHTFKIESQQIEGSQHRVALLILTMAAPARTHSGDNPIRPFHGYINSANLLAFLFVRACHTGDANGIICSETLTNGMSHGASYLFANRTILLDHFMRDTHLLFDFDTIGSDT